jgi:phosphoglycerate dehydrogenase-like enzyme
MPETNHKPKAIYVLSEYGYNVIYGPSQRRIIRQLVDLVGDAQTLDSIQANISILKEVEIILSGWGGPLCDKIFLDAAPNLKIVFYGAGSIRGIVTDTSWERGIRITSAWAANAVPVVEYTLASIIYCLKRAFLQSANYKQIKQWERLPVPSGYQSTVGIISLGMIGKMLVKKLKSFDLQVIAYDPFVSQDEAKKLGVKLVSLRDIFKHADVISLHTPWLPETEGMITGEHFSLMKPNASFINTARGAIVREAEMIRILQGRSDLFAVIDVTWPEPPDEDSLLYTLPNVFLTPHIAGAMETECQRMGKIMVEELKCYLARKPLTYEITREKARILA